MARKKDADASVLDSSNFAPADKAKLLLMAMNMKFLMVLP